MFKGISFGRGSHWRHKKRPRKVDLSEGSNTLEIDYNNIELDAQEFDIELDAQEFEICDDIYPLNEESKFNSIEDDVNLDELNHVEPTTNANSNTFEMYLLGSNMMQGDKYNVC